jgi:hypothetical protein
MLEGKSLAHFMLQGLTRPLSIAEARTMDVEDQVNDLKAMAVHSAAIELKLPPQSFAERTRTVAEARTSTKKESEDDDQFKMREEAECATLAYEQVLTQLPAASREYFATMCLFIDFRTGKVETKELRMKRMYCWSAFVVSSVRPHHPDLLASVVMGDFAGVIEKIMRVKTSWTRCATSPPMARR